MAKRDAMDGMDADGDSKNTFGPKPKSTPNKVGADGSISGKSGKGKITGGIEDESIFGGINYTGNTVEVGTKIGNTQTIDKSIFNGVDKFYSTDSRGFPADKGEGAFGSAAFAAGEKNKKVSGENTKDENKAEYVGKPLNKKHPIKASGGKNPTSLNVKLSKNILSK